MRVFVASLATETNTFSPLFVDRSAFESAFYCPPGTHPDTPTLCSAPMVAARRRARSGRLHADRRNRHLGRARRPRRRGKPMRACATKFSISSRPHCRSTWCCSACTDRWWRAATTIAKATCWRAPARWSAKRGHDRRRTRHALPPVRPDGRGRGRDRGVQGISAYGFSGARRRPRRSLPSRGPGRGQAGKRGVRLPRDRGLHDQPRAGTQLRRPHEGAWRAGTAS